MGAGATGITINAGVNDKINLRGLIIEGAGVGNTGIVFNTGKFLSAVLEKAARRRKSGGGTSEAAE